MRPVFLFHSAHHPLPLIPAVPEALNMLNPGVKIKEGKHQMYTDMFVDSVLKSLPSNSVIACIQYMLCNIWLHAVCVAYLFNITVYRYVLPGVHVLCYMMQVNLLHYLRQRYEELIVASKNGSEHTFYLLFTDTPLLSIHPSPQPPAPPPHNKHWLINWC